MNIKDSKHIHFTGIKGVGMTAVALCALDLGITVTGTDIEEEFVTDKILSHRHIKTNSSFDASGIPVDTDLLVYTGAHKGESNPQVIYARTKNIRTISQAHALAELMEGKSGISVCGVGGKSTTSAMIATILDHAHKKPSYAVGVGNIHPLSAPGRYDSGTHFVAEADEYAIAPGTNNLPKFSLQHPDIIVCTNIVHDHPDIYPSINDTLKVYGDFFKTLSQNQTLIINADNQYTKSLTQNLTCKVITYSHKNSSDYQIVSSSLHNLRQTFSVLHDQNNFDLNLQIPGEYNQSNGLAAYITALLCGVEPQTAAEGLLKFEGTKRRFEYISTKRGVDYYDDYAHHPSEIAAVLKAAKAWFNQRRIVAIFQPHTYSRTKSLLHEFSHCFTDSDLLILVPIFASAREGFDPDISSQILMEKTKQNGVNVNYLQNHEEVVEYLSKHTLPGDVVITIGAGDIYKLHNMI